MKKILAGALLGALLALGMSAPSMAQMYGGNNPDCGYMSGGQWVSNGNCDPNNHPWADGARHRGQLRGTIIAVNGNMVTVRTWHRGRITFNDGPALRRQTSGRVAVGRDIVANGFWRNGEFLATSIE
jgi:hypothetical protein